MNQEARIDEASANLNEDTLCNLIKQIDGVRAAMERQAVHSPKSATKMAQLLTIIHRLSATLDPRGPNQTQILATIDVANGIKRRILSGSTAGCSLDQILEQCKLLEAIMALLDAVEADQMREHPLI